MEKAVDALVGTRGAADWLRRTAPIWIAAIFASIIFAAPYQERPYDLVVHIQYAKTIHRFSDLTSPHFLFQLMLIVGNRLTGISYEAGAIVLMSVSYAFMAALIALRMKKLNPRADQNLVVWVTVLVLIASHIFLQTAFKHNFYYGYIAPVVYHNPTQVLCKALAIPIMFAYFSMAFKCDDAWLWRVVLPIAVILSAVAKPSFLIAFLPCVCAVELYRFCAGSRQAALRNAALVVLPACIVLALQFRMTYTGEGAGAGLGFSPFIVYGGAAEVLSKLPASLFFPAVAAVVIWRERLQTDELRFAWFLYFVGMIISTCFVETGVRMMQGNFAWTGQTVTFLLYVESAITLMALAPRRAWPAWSALGVHVFFGIIWYSVALLLPWGLFL